MGSYSLERLPKIFSIWSSADSNRTLMVAGHPSVKAKNLQAFILIFNLGGMAGMCLKHSPLTTVVLVGFPAKVIHVCE